MFDHDKGQKSAISQAPSALDFFSPHPQLAYPKVHMLKTLYVVFCLRTRSSTTRDRSLQFRGAVST